MMVKRMRFLDELLHCQGAPYVWKGKGMHLWDRDKGHIAHAFGRDVFDCAGLVTTALQRSGGPDWRYTHNAQTLFDLSIPAVLRSRPLHLLFYGPHEKAVDHVAVIIGCAACHDPPKYLKIEAAGGGRQTLVPQVPLGVARVMVRRENRTDFLGERMLPPDVLEPSY